MKNINYIISLILATFYFYNLNAQVDENLNISLYINNNKKTDFEIYKITGSSSSVIKVKDCISIDKSDYENYTVIVTFNDHIIEIPKDIEDISYIDVYYYSDAYNNTLTQKNQINFDVKDKKKYNKVYFFDFGRNDILTMRYEKKKIKKFKKLLNLR